MTDTHACGDFRGKWPPMTDRGFYPRYLAAKKGIDDRSLNRVVWDTLNRALPDATSGEAVRIIELGAGIGTMLERVVDWGLVQGDGSYLATDRAAEHLRAARSRLAGWAAPRDHGLHFSGDGNGTLPLARGTLAITLQAMEAEQLAAVAEPDSCHLLIAHALLDLVDFTRLLPSLLPLVKKNGLLYLTCNFDGETIFLPEHPGGEEAEIIRQYHASMEARVPGASRTGRRLRDFLPRTGLTVLAAGASDWLIQPRAGSYPEEEAFFLHAMVETVAQELARQNPPPGLASWARSRHRQIEAGELIFIARHLDILARAGESCKAISGESGIHASAL
jgi:hypothetical protein